MSDNILDKYNTRRLVSDVVSHLNTINYIDLCCPLLSEEAKRNNNESHWEAINDIMEKHYQHMTIMKLNFSRKIKDRAF